MPFPHALASPGPRPYHRAVDLRRLEHFLVVLECGTITAAAERLFVAQPALSRQISALERELGLDLFTRDRGRLQLTAAGARFATLARDLVAHADRVAVAAAGLADGAPQHLVVAAPMSTIHEVIAPYIVSTAAAATDPVVTAFDHPALRPADESLGRADLVVCAGAPSGDLATHVLGTVTLCGQVAADHPWAREARSRADLADLAEERLIVLNRDNMSRVLLDAGLAARGLTARVAAQCDVEFVVQALAAAGHGVGVLTERPRFGLHPVRLYDADAPMRLTLHASWEPGHYAAAAIADLAAGLGAVLARTNAEIAAEHGWRD